MFCECAAKAGIPRRLKQSGDRYNYYHTLSSSSPKISLIRMGSGHKLFGLARVHFSYNL